MRTPSVAMEEALTPDECEVVRKFLKSLVYGKKLNPDLDVSNFIKEYRRILNGYTIKKPHKAKRAARQKKKTPRNPKPWSIKEKKQLEELYKDYRNPELARMFGRSYSSITSMLTSMGLKREKGMKAYVKKGRA